MSFRHRVTLASALAVALAIAIASAATYLLVRNELSRHTDSTLGQLADDFLAVANNHGVHPSRPPLFGRRFPYHPGDVNEVFELASGNGAIYPFLGQRLALSAPQRMAVEAVASAGSGSVSFDATARTTQYRVLATGVEPGYAVLVTHGLTEANSTLSELRLILVLITLGGAALASLLGWFVARTTLAPMRRLTAAVQRVADTQDLGERIDERRRDELGILARSFNAMLAEIEQTVHKLDESARVQRRLVADASHELRTPVTSLRTNIEVLERADELPAGERTRLIADVVEQLEELSSLINDLIELAREEEHVDAREDVRFDELVAEAIERARLHAPAATFDAQLEPTLVSGVPARLDRAVNNLLDNAVKFAGTGAPIEVDLHDGELAVRDHGPGIAVEDLPHVFDRFFRGARSRALPGSGLGLAIVRQVVELHGGRVSAEPAPGGGTIVRIWLPVEAWDHAEAASPAAGRSVGGAEPVADVDVDAELRELGRPLAREVR
jgi:two-component system, OmpR family, sensor histidine kinase MprB